MTTTEKLEILNSKKGATVELTTEAGDLVSALVKKVDGEGDGSMCYFMDVYEGVERWLSVSNITKIKADQPAGGVNAAVRIRRFLEAEA